MFVKSYVMKGFCLFLCSFFFFSFNLLAQNKFTVTGVVTSQESGEKLSFVNIVEKGTTNGTVSDMDGFYTFDVSDLQATLLFSYMGETTEVQVNGNSKLNVQLKGESLVLDDFVVVGYGTAKRREVIGSVSSIKSDDLNKIPTSSFDGALQGKAAGVQVSMNTGVPGAPVNVMIRGKNSITQGVSPLWVIDGIPVSSSQLDQGSDGSTAQSPMSLINPNDIESIEVLKDAAATAIYGSRASHGVILVTTKSGAGGEKGITSLNFGYSVGFSNLPKNPRNMYVDGETWLAMADEAIGNFSDGDSSVFLPTKITVYNESFDSISREQALATNTDWFDQVLRDYGTYHDVNFSGVGNYEKSSVYFSVNYRNDQSLNQNNNFDRITGRVNLDLKPYKYFKTGIKLNSAYTINDRIKSDRNPGAYGAGGGRSGGFGAANRGVLPWFPVENEDNMTGYWSAATGLNLAANLDDALIEDKVETFRSMGGLYGEFLIPGVEGLSLRSELSFDVIQSSSNFWLDKYMTQDTVSKGSNRIQNHRNMLYNVYANYTKSFKAHNFAIVAGTESQTQLDKINDVEAWGLTGQNHIIGVPDRSEVDFHAREYKLRSYFSRISYSLMDRYLLGVTYRTDGSSKFNEDLRWGNFAGLSLGWIMTDEDFLRDLRPVMNFMKLRGSVGQTGSDKIPPNKTISQVSYNQNWRYGYPSYIAAGSRISSIGNPSLAWESTSNVDVGFDYGFLQNRLTGSFAYYYRYIDGLLIEIDLPPSTGAQNNKIFTNAGILSDYGVEFSLTSVNMHNQASGFRWSTDFNIASNDNTILQLTDFYDNSNTGIYELEAGNRVRINKTGQKIQTYYMADFAGIDQEHGVEMIWEMDADHFEKTGETRRTGRMIPATLDNTQENRFLLEGKTPMPTYYGGLNNTFTYKRFDVSIFFTFSGGNYIYDNNMKRTSYFHNGTNVMRKEILDNTWTPENKDAAYMQLTDNGKNPWNMDLETGEWVYSESNPGNYSPEERYHTQFLFRGDYIRLKTVQIGYNIPEETMARLHLASARIYATATNLFTYAFDYPGYDPEGISWVDAYNLPNLRTYTVGVSLRF